MIFKLFIRFNLLGTLGFQLLPCMANSSGSTPHQSSPLDLIFPIINVVALFAILHFASRKSVDSLMVARSEKTQQSKADFENQKKVLENNIKSLEQLEKGFAQFKELRNKEVQKIIELEKEKLDAESKIQEERIYQETLDHVENFRVNELKNFVSGFLMDKRAAIATKVKVEFTAEREIKYVEQYLKELQ